MTSIRRTLLVRLLMGMSAVAILATAATYVETRREIGDLETYEEDAWTGIRWRIRAKTFAHVMVAQAGFESSFRDATGVADPTTILTFRATGDELLALVHVGMPFYKPPWSPTIVGMVIDDDTDWDEVAELVTESYRFCAPMRLARLLDSR